MMFTLPVLGRWYTFRTNLVQKTKMVRLNWNLESQINDKIYWRSLYYHLLPQKYIWLTQRHPKFPLPLDSMFHQAWKIYAWKCWPGMSKQTHKRTAHPRLTIFITDCRLIRIFKIQWGYSLFRLRLETLFSGKFGLKKHNC